MTPRRYRQLTHRNCGQVLDLIYVPRPVTNSQGAVTAISEPALSCPRHGRILDLLEVDPPGSLCLITEEEAAHAHDEK